MLIVQAHLEFAFTHLYHLRESDCVSSQTLGGVLDLPSVNVFPMTLLEGQRHPSPACDWSVTVLFKALVSAL